MSNKICIWCGKPNLKKHGMAKKCQSCCAITTPSKAYKLGHSVGREKGKEQANEEIINIVAVGEDIKDSFAYNKGYTNGLENGKKHVDLAGVMQYDIGFQDGLEKGKQEAAREIIEDEDICRKLCSCATTIYSIHSEWCFWLVIRQRVKERYKVK